MRVEWKDFIKKAAPSSWLPGYPMSEDERRHRIWLDDLAARHDSDEAEARPDTSSGTAISAKPYHVDYGGGVLRSGTEDMQQALRSPTADFVANLGGRVREGRWGEIGGTAWGALNEIGQGWGGYRGVKLSPKPYNLAGRRYDSGRLAAAGYLAEKSGKPVTREMLNGNMHRTDPWLSNSEVLSSMPRWKLRRALRQGDGALLGTTYRNLSEQAMFDGKRRGSEAWPSTVFDIRKGLLPPVVIGWDESGSPGAVFSYTDKAGEIPSLTFATDGHTPTSGEVARKLSKGYTREDILRDWLGAVFSRYRYDRNSSHGVMPKKDLNAGLLEQWHRIHPEREWTLEDYERLNRGDILSNPSAEGYAERKFIYDVPFNGDYIRAIMSSHLGSPRPHLGSLADDLEVPYIDPKIDERVDWSSIPPNHRLDLYEKMLRRSNNVFRGDLDKLRNVR